MNILKEIFKKSLVFLKRDILESASYKFSFVFNYLEIFGSLLLFFFIAKLFSGKANLYLGAYGGDYFSYVIIGIAFGGFLTAGLASFKSIIAIEQGTGTFEAILLSPTKISTVLIAGSLLSLIFTIFNILLYLSTGILIFNLKIISINLFALLTTFLFSLVCFYSIGLFSAGFMLIFKQGDPFTHYLGSASRFLAGVYFPLAVLPLWVKKISFLIPFTHALEAIRKILLSKATVFDVLPQLKILFLFNLVFLPSGILFFKYALKRAKRDGSLVFY